MHANLETQTVIDLDRLECLVGRVQNGGYIAIIDQTGEWQDAAYARDD